MIAHAMNYLSSRLPEVLFHEDDAVPMIHATFNDRTLWIYLDEGFKPAIWRVNDREFNRLSDLLIYVAARFELSLTFGGGSVVDDVEVLILPRFIRVFLTSEKVDGITYATVHFNADNQLPLIENFMPFQCFDALILDMVYGLSDPVRLAILNKRHALYTNPVKSKPVYIEAQK